MRRSIITVLALAAAALALPAQAAAPAVDLQPEKLTRGADIAVPHIEDGPWGGVFVDGSRRIELPGRLARVIGESGDSWLVGTANVGVKRNQRVVRVGADGTVTNVLRAIPESTVILSADGSTLAWQKFTSKGRKVTVRVASAVDGVVVAEKGPGSPVDLLDVTASSVVLTGRSRTFQWDFTTGRSRTIVRKRAQVASVEHDLISYYTKDPYRGGCTKLARLRSPNLRIWTSCEDRVAAVSPDGTQVLTFHILTDGLGPGEIELRTRTGTTLATWSTGWFSDWSWESPGVVLLQANGKRKAATVRCTLTACENASDPEATPNPRGVPRSPAR